MKHKYDTSALAIFLAVLMLLCPLMQTLPVTVSAASSSELKNQLDALENEKTQIDAQIKELREQLSGNATELQALVDEKSVIDQEIVLLYQQEDNINNQIATYNLMIADKQVELDKAQKRLDDLIIQNKERIRTMEEEGSLSYWSVLFKATSFADFLDRLNMIQEIAAADRRRMQEIADAAQLVKEVKAELELQKADLVSTKEELHTTQKTLEAKQTQTLELLQQMIAKGDEFQAMLEKAEEMQLELMDQIANKKDEYDDVKYQEWLATSVPPTTKPVTKPNAGGAANTVNGITWLVPCNYVYFSSPFGYRWHPLDGKWKMHNGVDLAAYMNTPIVATRSGVVTYTDFERYGAGNYVVINHGDGYRSVYMHMTRYIVSPGQYVSAGEVIGYVGSSGASDGPHLHFGISYNGTYVNPADYITIK